MLTEKHLEELRQERHDDYQAEARSAREAVLNLHRLSTLSHYSQEQQDAALHLYNAARTMLDTGGGGTCARLLLGLYNGGRFPFDLTDLRRLDGGLHRAAMIVINMDSRHTWCEIHVLLDAILAVPGGKSTGATMELWAHDLRLKGRSNKAAIPDLRMRCA
jgi:hypothetical protein